MALPALLAPLFSSSRVLAVFSSRVLVVLALFSHARAAFPLVILLTVRLRVCARVLACVHVCVCVCVCVCVFMHTHTSTHTHTCSMCVTYTRADTHLPCVLQVVDALAGLKVCSLGVRVESFGSGLRA